ncbi:hypothetical protein LDENG_00052120 [Lucifuga dentata]|nr:hypothetical protein LDENG_00052120 [Lucifuga dentata]
MVLVKTLWIAFGDAAAVTRSSEANIGETAGGLGLSRELDQEQRTDGNKVLHKAKDSPTEAHVATSF